MNNLTGIFITRNRTVKGDIVYTLNFQEKDGTLSPQKSDKQYHVIAAKVKQLTTSLGLVVVNLAEFNKWKALDVPSVKSES